MSFMKNWNNKSYQKITRVSLLGDSIKVHFEDSSEAVVKKNSIFKDSEELQWEQLTFSNSEIQIPDISGNLNAVSWTKIRVLSDVEFSKFLAEKAEEEAKSIGLKIKALRERANLKSKELAERSGLTPQSISRIEKGKQDVNLRTLSRMLAAMGFSLKDLTNSPKPSYNLSLETLLQKLKGKRVPDYFIKTKLLFDIDDDLFKKQVALTSNVKDKVENIFKQIFDIEHYNLWNDSNLEFNTSAFNKALYKNPYDNKDDFWVKFYTQYIQYISELTIKVTPDLKKAEFPENTEEVRNEILKHYGHINYSNFLKYALSLGIIVLPQHDTGVFHGVSLNINGRHVIVLKQKNMSPARWLFDGLHELYHILAHLSDDKGIIWETSEISPVDKIISDEREKEANAFAREMLFKGIEEEMLEECVSLANGKVELLKNAVIKVANKNEIDTGVLANYIAFRLQMQGTNWWGTATNLQDTTNNPFDITKDFLLSNFNLSILNEFEKAILLKSLQKL